MSRLLGKTFVSFIVFLLCFMNFFGMYFSDSQGLLRSANNQPDNSFIQYIWGGVSDQKDAKYGWNITYISNLNGDVYPDLVISTPWYDSALADVGAVFIFWGKADSGFDDINHSQADVTILGDGLSNKFGWDVADAGDLNNDGINDLIVGAPGVLNGKGRAYIFFGGTIPDGNFPASNLVDRMLEGKTDNGFYGTAVTGVGDINNDGYGDVLVGAPGADQTVITYGYKNKVTFYPDLWDDDLSTPSLIDFSNGVNNFLNATYTDNNSWGLDGDDDGWDWIDSFSDPTRLYGRTIPAPQDHANLYAPWEPDRPDADGLTWSNRTALEVMIGRNHTDYNPYGLDNDSEYDPGASAAWGIEFNITAEMYNYLSSNSTITLGFDYCAMDSNRIYNNSNRSRRIISIIRSRIWNGTTIDYIGNEFQSNKKCVFYKEDQSNTPPWGPIYDSFKWDITDYFDHIGSYYWDFGCYFDRCYKNRADDGLMAFFDNITMKITNDKSVPIVGMKNSGFGSSITALGDINGDGYPDAMIGAPNLDGGYAALLSGKKRFNTSESIGISTIILTGKNLGDKFGYSVAGAGDVDNDGIVDVIIGAPGGNYANLYYGSTLNAPLLFPDLWEVDVDKSTPYIEFDSGLKSTGNTPGFTGANDGWDTWDGVYGFQSGETPGSSVMYNGADDINSPQVAADDELIIYIGGELGGGGWFDARKDSGAYGVKFSVSQNMITALESGAEAILSYDCRFKNLGLDQDDTVWIKTFIRNSAGEHALGWALDKDTLDEDNKDDTNETHWAELPEDVRSVFIQDCSEHFLSAGSYYLDIGAKVGYYSWENSLYEDGVFHFDNVYLRINPLPDIKFTGPADSGFGFGVGYCDKFNLDDYDDIIISAPYYNSPNGNDSGAIFGFFMGPNTDKLRSAEIADFISYGERADDNFGRTLLGVESLDSDEFSEIMTSAVNYDLSLVNVGRIYILSITNKPRIKLIYPQGGEVLSGNVTINATATDPDDNIDNGFGVQFYYSMDLDTWTIIGDDKTPTLPNNIYEQTWDTTILPDGSNYYLKCWVRDLYLNTGENISSAVTIDNLHPPKLSIKSPKLGETIAGTIEIKAMAKDSSLDIIGGGINTSNGVNFYLSKDKVAWELLGNIQSGTQDEYVTTLETPKYPDGEYWIKVNASDWDGFEVEEMINVTIDNPGRPPSITLLAPLDKEEVSGITVVRATAFDFDGDINSSGITFLISMDTTIETWQLIGNVPIPVINSTGAHIYSMDWDTTTVPDNWYQLKAYIMDNESFTNESAISKFKVHNDDKNPPIIELIAPQGGEILMETQMLTARVRDLEDNIDSHGVDYYYSQDKVKWRYIGTTANPRSSDIEFYDFLWQTSAIPDGEYWLNVSVSDDTQLKSWDVSDDPIIIHNSNLNAPFIKILTPIRGQHIKGTFTLQASALDLEDNINTNGVLFSYSTGENDWTIISNTPSPIDSQNTIYELPWDTTIHPEGKYWLRAEATDFDGLLGIDTSDYFFIHNSLENPPSVKFLGPNSGEVSGIIKVNASVFDLENNINENGINFYHSTDNETWQRIANDPSGSDFGDEEQYFEISWDTSLVPDDIYWLRAEAQDLTELIGYDTSDDYIIVHNKLTNPPRIIFKQPQKGVPLDPIQSIIVEVFDFDNDVDSVSFLYSTDNETWVLIDSRLKPEKGDIYRTMWMTEKIYNGEYYIKIIAKDKIGNQEEVTAGPFEVTMGKEKDVGPKEDYLASNFIWIIISLIIIIIMVLLVVLMLRRSKHREKELIKEVSDELRAEKEQSDGELDTEPEQTYVPPTQVSAIPAADVVGTEEDIEHYRDQMDAWRTEGYLVTRLENLFFTDRNMFLNAFPKFKMNVAKLKDISSKLDAMDTTGYDIEISTIRAKLFNPDQAMAAENEFNDLQSKLGLGVVPRELDVPSPGITPELAPVDEIIPQLMPGEPAPQVEVQMPVVEGEVQVPPETEIPPDVELPPDIGLPPKEPAAPPAEGTPNGEVKKPEEEEK